MGRAIDMEKDIDEIKNRLDKFERTLKGIAYTLDELEGKSSKTKQRKSDEKKKTNDEGNGKSSGKSNKRNKTDKK